MNKKRLYFDYAASTPVDPRVVKAIKPYMREQFGNPGSVHSFGQEAMHAVDSARESCARAIGAGHREILFTASATEANNLALRGVIRRFWRTFFDAQGKKTTKKILPHIIITGIEHESVLETAKDIEKRGVASVTILPVDRDGMIALSDLRRAITNETVLVSVMYASNEIGSIQSIQRIAEIIKEHKNIKTKYPLFHTDAVQAFQYLDCDTDTLGVDLMTLSAQKLYGPKGIGLLYIRGGKDAEIDPLITGGGQEYGLRSGTPNVPALVGFGEALRIAKEMRKKEYTRVLELQEYFFTQIRKHIPGVNVFGSTDARVPNNINIGFREDAHDLLVRLDRMGIAISSGSACSSRSIAPSHVLRALGYDELQAKTSIRITLGRPTTKKDIDALLRALIQLNIS